MGMFKWLVVIVAVVFAGILWESPTARRQFMREMDHARLYVNREASKYEAWQIMAVSVGVTIILMKILSFLMHEEFTLWERCRLTAFRVARSLPVVSSMIEKELAKTRRNIEKDLLTSQPGETYRLALPDKGLTYDEIMRELDNFDKLNKYDKKSGRVSGCFYNCNEALTKLTTDVYGRYCWTNPLHTDVFPEVRKMESEIIQWCVKLFNGGPDGCGCVTSGGTESILMAMKCYRAIGYSKGIKFPEIVCSKATHPAFDKAAQMFRMKITYVPCDPLTRKVNLKAMSRAISSNTVVLVGSAPHYPHGIIDPIQEMAKLACKNNIGLHVDSCLGGLLLPFMDDAGYPIDPFDFRVPGVTSISADTHKYGFAPKGSSVVLYANKEIRRHQYTMTTDWEGGLYASLGVAGSRPGGIIAATWAVMMSMGYQGYVDSARAIVGTTRWIVAQLEATPHIYILGEPLASVFAFASKDFNVYHLHEALSKKGWNLSALQFPPAIHVSVTNVHTRDDIAQSLVNDIKATITEVMKQNLPNDVGAAAIYGTSQSVSDRSIVSQSLGIYIDTMLTAGPPQVEQPQE
jgi:sphinganine-1-phosphate aldolase